MIYVPCIYLKMNNPTIKKDNKNNVCTRCNYKKKHTGVLAIRIREFQNRQGKRHLKDILNHFFFTRKTFFTTRFQPFTLIVFYDISYRLFNVKPFIMLVNQMIPFK